MLKEKKKLCFALDLTWVRHGIVGGTESFVCNLLDGFREYLSEASGEVEILMLASKDNYDVFQKYVASEISILKCNVLSADRIGRLLWQNLKMGKMLKKMEIYMVLEPVYSKPFFGTNRMRYVTVIHDLQAWHFPEYFSWKRVCWMKCCWQNAVRTSAKVVAISEFTKRDILEKIPCKEYQICVIPDPIVMNQDVAGKDVLDYFGLREKEYYYTVSSQKPHKNLETLLRVMGVLRKRRSSAMRPLVISGVGDGVTRELQQIVEEESLKSEVIFTGFIEEKKRNTLYQNCRAFLFPSIFEGFGMPLLEAMAMQVPVLTTECTSIKEVTGGLVNYIHNPKDVGEWVSRLEQELLIPKQSDVAALLQQYEKKCIAKQYLQLMRGVAQ